MDTKNHLVVDYKVTDSPSDLNQLSPVVISAKETLEVEQIDCFGDKGYFDFLQIKQCVDNGVTPYIAVKKSGSGGSTLTPEFTADKFVYDRGADVYACPAGHRLAFSFLSVREGMEMRIYKCSEGVCSSCSFFMNGCTRNRAGRTIWRWVHEDFVDQMRMRMKLHPEVMEERRKVAEHPFGTLKRAFGAPYCCLRSCGRLVERLGCL